MKMNNVAFTVVSLVGVALIASIAISSCNNPNGIGRTYSDNPDVDLHLYAPYNGYGDGGGHYTQPQRVYQDNSRTTIINRNVTNKRKENKMGAIPPAITPIPSRLPKPKEQTGIDSLPRVPMPSSPVSVPAQVPPRRIERPSSSFGSTRSYSPSRSSSSSSSSRR